MEGYRPTATLPQPGIQQTGQFLPREGGFQLTELPYIYYIGSIFLEIHVMEMEIPWVV